MGSIAFPRDGEDDALVYLGIGVAMLQLVMMVVSSGISCAVGSVMGVGSFRQKRPLLS